MYRTLLRLALENAETHPLMIHELGLPLTSGPWYNASVDLTHAGHIASCKLTLIGRNSSSDVLIRAVRRGGQRSTLLYNLIGRGHLSLLLNE
ncbi:hypothetical protein WJX81_006124 [Elliptochloris bilobata]|uniref:Uncharacterized protein n=1 Tax=Elliptochloris bilobata TaxID=381761 RepID=A0AAW1SJ84_9CHLO